MLAYYQNEERIAQQTVHNPDTGIPIWIEGKSYQVTPSWDREKILVDNFSEQQTEECQEIPGGSNPELTILGNTSTKIEGAQRIEQLNQTSINFGYSTFLIQGEDGRVHKVKETLNRENSDLEKERIAEEIQFNEEQIEKLEEVQTTPKENDEKKPAAKAPKITPAVKRQIKELKEKIQTLEEELNSWKPNIDDFLECFPPEPPPLSTQIYEEELKKISKQIVTRFAPFLPIEGDTSQIAGTQASSTIKNYQIRGSALMALKRSTGNGGPPGSGKTLTSIMASWAMGHHYVIVIAPTIALNTWAKELERVGLYHEVIGYKKAKNGIWKPNASAYQDIRRITQGNHQRIRKTNRLGKIEPEYYIISAETLSLGGDGNLQYLPWHFDYPLNEKNFDALQQRELPNHWEIVERPIKKWKKADFKEPKVEKIGDEEIWYGQHLRIWSDRSDNEHELKKNKLKGMFKTVTFRKAIKQCPVCGTEGKKWSNRGNCQNCGHNHSTFAREASGWKKEQANLTDAQRKARGMFFTGTLKHNSQWEGSKKSNAQYPGYKLLGKHFGLKIIDEIHNFSSFTSQHGKALLQIKTKSTIVLSGTLCRTHITELEPTLCHIYEPNSGEFPYSSWGMELFEEQFSTYEISSTTQIRRTRENTQARRKNNTIRIPEASNLTKLKSLMHGVLVSVSEKEMAREWNLMPISERIQYVELQEASSEIYEEWQNKIKEAFQSCRTPDEKSTMFKDGRKMLTNLGYACDGPEKLQASVEWIKEGIAKGQRSVVVGPSTRFYTLLNEELKRQGIPFTPLGSMPAEKRFEVLDKFRDSDCPVLTSRIRLIGVNFNQLTCCQRILFTGVDPSPSFIRQMQKRLNRIGQTQIVECVFLITRGREILNRSQITNDNLRNLEEEVRTVINAPQLKNESEEESIRKRPPSYEERLMATIMRREKAIQAVLNQADKQRDPQELYNMLQERQTLNQVLQDIATDASSDMSILDNLKKPSETNHPKATEPMDKNPSKKNQLTFGI